MVNLVRIGVVASLLAGMMAFSQKFTQSSPNKIEVAEKGFFRLETGSGYEIRQPGSPIGMTISDAGILEMSPILSGSHTRVRLESYGYGATKTLAPRPSLEAENNQQLNLTRPGIDEWLRNTDRGVEQFFRVSNRPTNAISGKLWVKLSLGGDLTPKLVEEGRVELESERGSEICYTGLKAWDAKGAPLDARMEVMGNSIQISVDDKAAQYPVTIDPTWGQQDRISLYGGSATAISGDTAAIGGGGVLIAIRDHGVWQTQQILNPPVLDDLNSFGSTIALSGDTLIVGAPNANKPATPRASGLVFVYSRTGTNWTLVQTIAPSQPFEYGDFGFSVAFEGDTMVIGAIGEDVGKLETVGAAYVYTRTGGIWNQTSKITSPNLHNGAAFGYQVSIAGGRIVVSTDVSRIHTYLKSGSTYTKEATISQTNAIHVSLFGDRMLIGTTLYRLQSGAWVKEATFDGEYASGNAIQADLVAIGNAPFDGTGLPGSVMFYRYIGGQWVAGAKLSASDGESGDHFGASLALEGNTLVVGAPHASDGLGNHKGRGYVFYQGNARMVFDKTLLRSGETVNGQIFIQTPAPAGGITIPLVSSNPNLTIPNQVVIAAGGKHVDFKGVASKSINAPGDATVAAVVNGETLKSPLRLDSLIKSVALTFPIYGNVAPCDFQGTVKLNVPAPAGGAIVALTSSNRLVLKLPTKVIVPENETSVSFTGSTYLVKEATPVTVTATYRGASVAATTTINPMLASLSVYPDYIAANSRAFGSIGLRMDTNSSIVVSLTSSQPSVAPVPATVTVPAGSRSFKFPVEIAPNAPNTTVTFTATYLGAKCTSSLNVVPQDIASYQFSPKTIKGGSGQVVSLRIMLVVAAGHGGVDLPLSSSNPAIAPVDASIHIPEGDYGITAKITPRAVTSNQTVTITLRLGTTRKIDKILTITP